MLRQLYFPLLLGGSLLAAQPAAAFLVGIPLNPATTQSPPPATQPTTQPTTQQPSSQNVQFQSGYDLGYEQGFGRGLQAGVDQCNAQPASCGIALSAVGAPAGNYAEIEPNDSMTSANTLINGTAFRGNSFGPQDGDWYKIYVGEANRAMTLNFALADIAAGSLAGWTIEVRNSFGVTQASFNTGSRVVPNTLDGITHRVTLGREGWYYLIIKPIASAYNFEAYRLTVSLNQSPTTPDQGPPVGHFDAETEPNDTPATADRLNESISMYGLINLTFDSVVPGEENYTWAQGEPDWYYFESPGNQILNLNFCDRQVCSAGNWLVRVFSFTNPPTSDVADSQRALATFNTTTCGGDPCAPGVAVDEPEPWYIGVIEKGNYYIRVDHKRLLTAPCDGYAIDENNNGRIDPDEKDPCGCDSGYSCDIDIVNPSSGDFPFCPDGSSQTATCNVDCVCTQPAGGGGVTCETDYGDCSCDTLQAGTCEVEIPNPGGPYRLCPDGTGGGTETQCSVGCICTSFGGVVELPSTTDDDTGDYTSQYNFSLTTNPFAGPR